MQGTALSPQASSFLSQLGTGIPLGNWGCGAGTKDGSGTTLGPWLVLLTTMNRKLPAALENSAPSRSEIAGGQRSQNARWHNDSESCALNFASNNIRILDKSSLEFWSGAKHSILVAKATGTGGTGVWPQKAGSEGSHLRN